MAYQKTFHEKMCHFCWTPFTTSKSQAKYCSKQCAGSAQSAAWFAKRRSGKPGNCRSPEGSKKPLADTGYVEVVKNGYWQSEHRVVMEEMLGRQLIKGCESVHHLNGVRSDNRPENLELWVGSPRYGQRASDIRCPHCCKAYHQPKSGQPTALDDQN